MTADLPMGGNKVTGLGTPTAEGDAVPKGYADSNFAPAVESADYPGCYYRTVNGVVEWDNPPMLPGVEYRTTKRHNGAAVYTKLLSYSPASFAAQTVSLPHEIANLGIGLSINVSWLMNGNQRRHFQSVYYGDNAWNGQTYWDGTTGICFELGTLVREYMAASVQNILVTVEYTKTV